MNALKLAAAGVLACLLVSSFTPADAQGGCANVGITLNSACGQFTDAIKQNYQQILSTPCGQLATTLAEPQYGTPSAACCNAAAGFFPAGCACDPGTQTQAQLFYGWSVDQLKAAATAAALRCNAAGCGNACSS